MGFFLTSLRLQFKTTFKLQLITIALLLLTLILMGSILKKQDNSIAINVGLIYEDNIGIHQKIYETLKQNKIINLIPYSYEQLQVFENDIKASKLECGYVLDKSMDEKIDGNDYTKLITSISSPSSIATGIVDEAVMLSFMKATAPGVATQFLNIHGIDKTTSEIDKLIDGYYKDGIFTKVNYITSNDNTISENEQLEFKLDLNWIFHGTIALFNLIIIIFYSAAYINNRQQNISLKLKAKTKIIFNMSIMTNLIILNAINSMIGLIVVKLLYKIEIYQLLAEIIMLFAYSTALASMAIFIITALKKSDIIFSLFPVVVMSTMIFGGIFFNISDINTIFQKISFAFLPFHYINGLNNNYIYETGILLIFSCITNCTVLCIEGNRRK